MAPCVLSVQELHWVTQSFLIWKHFHQGSRMEPSSWFHFAMRYRLKQLVWTLPPINPVAEWCRSCVFGDKHWHWTCCIGEPAGDCSVALNMSLWCRWCKSAPSLCMKLSSMQKQKGWSFLVLFFQNPVFTNPLLPIVFLIMLSLSSNFLSQFVLLLPFLLLLNEAPGGVRIKK